MTDALDTARLFWPAFVASLVIATACGLLGVHIVARRMVLVGLALPQTAAFGVAFTMAVVFSHGHDAPTSLVALAFVLAAATALAAARARGSIDQGTAAGVLFALAGAGMILLLSRSAQGIEEVHHLVEGNLLALTAADVARLSAALVPVVIVLLVGSRRLMLCTFDREFAASLGVRVWLWEAVFYAALAVTVSVAVHAAGVLFVFGFLVLPGAAGVLAGRTTRGIILVGLGIALAAAVTGFMLSCSSLDLPTAPACVAAAGAALLVCSLGRRRSTREYRVRNETSG